MEPCYTTDLDQALADHVVEGRNHLVHSDGVVAHPQDPIELGGHEGHAGLSQRLGECLILNVNSTEGDNIC